MAMEMKFIIHGAHTRAISAMGLNAHRKELWVAGKDGIIRIFDCSSGKLRLKLTEHTGHVTSISYYANMKSMFSTGIDGSIIAWTSSGTVYDKVFLSEPIYNLELHARKRMAIVALKTTIRLYHIDEWKESGHVINMKRAKQDIRAHDDIIKKIVAHETKVFSIGLDAILCMYEFPTFTPSVQLQQQNTPNNSGGQHGADFNNTTERGNAPSSSRHSGSSNNNNAADNNSATPTNAGTTTTSTQLRLIRRVVSAHGAGITDIDICYSQSSSATTNTAETNLEPAEKDQWVVVTSSYDHTVKIWTSEVRLISTVEMPGAVLSVAFCLDSQFIWVCSESHHYPAIIDPRTCENITEMTAAFHDWQSGGLSNTVKRFEMLRYFRDFHTLVGVIDARDVVLWKYNAAGAFLCMKCAFPTECVAVTEKPPNFIVFTGDSNGTIVKWEKPATSHHKLISAELDVSNATSRATKPNQEIYKMAPIKELLLSQTDSAELMLPDDVELTKQVKVLQYRHPIQKIVFNELLDLLVASNDDGMIYVWGYTSTTERKVKANKLLKKRLKAATATAAAEFVDNNIMPTEADKQKNMKMDNKSQAGRRNNKKYGQKAVFKTDASPAGCGRNSDKHLQNNSTTANAVSGHGDDDEASKIESFGGTTVNTPYRTLSEEAAAHAILADKEGFETVLNRVAGFTCKHVLWGHDGTVSGLVCVSARAGKPPRYLLSTGWDRRICLWDLEKGMLIDLCKRIGIANPVVTSTSDRSSNRRVSDNNDEVPNNTNKNNKNSAKNQSHTNSTAPDMEYVADAQITDIDFCPTRMEFAYSSMDGLVYVRKFHLDGRKMTLVNVLDGYKCPVVTCKYHSLRHAWLTAGEDCSIRMWSAEDFNAPLVTIDCGKKVQVLGIDMRSGAILAGIARELRVYDPVTGQLLQTNRGHRDNVSGVAHVAETDMYVTVCWDSYVRSFHAVLPSQVPSWRRAMMKSSSNDSTNNVKKTEQQQQQRESLAAAIVNSDSVS